MKCKFHAGFVVVGRALRAADERPLGSRAKKGQTVLFELQFVNSSATDETR
jgi:hypothetical protein